MIDTKQIETLKAEVSKEFVEKQEANNMLNTTMDLVVKNQDQGWIIKDEPSYLIAVQLQKIIHKLDKKIVAHHKPIKQAADAVKRSILDAEKKARGDIIAAKGILAGAIGTWLKKKKEEAREKARIEQERIEEERLRVAQEKMEEAQELKKQATPESMQNALNLENEVEDLLDSPIPPVRIEQPAKVSGTRVVEYWKFKITDRTLIPSEFWIIDIVEIGRVVRAMKDKTNIPGVEVWSETQNQVTGR